MRPPDTLHASDQLTVPTRADAECTRIAGDWRGARKLLYALRPSPIRINVKERAREIASQEILPVATLFGAFTFWPACLIGCYPV